jgi:hypothetical protein
MERQKFDLFTHGAQRILGKTDVPDRWVMIAQRDVLEGPTFFLRFLQMKVGNCGATHIDEMCRKLEAL